MSTSRTDALDKTVQGQNWGYRDMFLLAQKIETELAAMLNQKDDELAKAKADKDRLLCEAQELRRKMTVSQIQAAEFEIEARKEKADSVVDYRKVAEWLYMVLDDIDSADDHCRSDDKFYRSTVQRLQALKNKVGNSPDGQRLEFKNPVEDYGLTRLFSK